MCNQCDMYKNQHPDYNYCPICGYCFKFSDTVPRNMIDNRRTISTMEYIKKKYSESK